MITVKIPFPTPSNNHIYFNFKGRRGLTDEARLLRFKITNLIRGTIHDIPKDKPLKVTARIHENWYCLNGTIKRADVANREKFLIDSVFNTLGIDDKNIFESIMIKVQNRTNEFAIITIEELKEDE